MKEETKNEFEFLEKLCEFVDENGENVVGVSFTIGMSPDDQEFVKNLVGADKFRENKTAFEFNLTKEDLNKLNDMVNNYVV